MQRYSSSSFTASDARAGSGLRARVYQLYQYFCIMHSTFIVSDAGSLGENPFSVGTATKAKGTARSIRQSVTIPAKLATEAKDFAKERPLR